MPSRKEKNAATEEKIIAAIHRYERNHNSHAPKVDAIARFSRMPEPTVYHYLQSMKRRHLVEERGKGRYGTADVLEY